MAKILSPRTEPSRQPIARRHAPKKSAYERYRACLRWDFGFTCAFCLTHESDLTEHGVEGWGLFWIEHFVPRSVNTSLIDVYSNCHLSCRFCNEARGEAPNTDPIGRRLLDPCVVAWGEHFQRNGDALLPMQRDPDAKYTWETYDLDDERKKQMRRTRDTRISEAIEALRKGPEYLERLLDAAARCTSAESREFLAVAEDLRRLLRQKRADLERHVATPRDRDEFCRCATPNACTLPQHVADQCIEIE